MQINWLPSLFKNGANVEISVGVSADNKWFTRWGNKEPSLIGQQSNETTMLWPLLDNGCGGNYKIVHEMLESRLAECNLSKELLKNFPFLDIAMHAFKSSTRQNSAIEWIAHLEFDEQLALFSSEIIHNKNYSQEARHMMKKKLHNWEKSNNMCFLNKKANK